jgi:NTP pyrophosphatase (non-canonical NTP hydrolase)
MLNGALGLCGEAGETADIVKKHFFQGHDLDKEDLKNEMGDCLWYIAVLAHSAGIELHEVARYNIEKLKKRYPDGFSFEKSINRQV